MIFLAVLIVLCVVLAIYRPQIKGYIGEKAVANRLSGLSPQSYIVLNDIMLPTSYGTTQIDHIVVSVYGIFVIETKNYKGWITGSEYGEQWTKNMYGKKYLFRNPLKQNYAHVKALESILGFSDDKFIPIVAFSGESNIKVQTAKPVIYIGQLKRAIETYREIKFSENELQNIVIQIQNVNIQDKDSRKQHVEQIRNQVKNDNVKIASGICPKCGANLIRRNGKYGAFWGCSNYPKCRYTKN